MSTNKLVALFLQSKNTTTIFHLISDTLLMAKLAMYAHKLQEVGIVFR